MAGVELTLTKSDSGTQCPRLPSNSAGAPTDNGSTALSKSRKKRLRKKKKIESETSAKKDLSERSKTVGKNEITPKLPSVDAPDLPAKGKSGSVDDVNKVENNSPQGHKLFGDTIEKPCAVVHCQKSRTKKVEEDSKQKKAPDHPNTEGSIANHLSLQSQPQPVISQVETSRVAMDSTKSKDEIMAQREAKKLAKLAKKNKSGGGGTPATPIQPDSKANQQNKTTPKQTEPSKNLPNAHISSPVSAVTVQMKQVSLDSVDGEINKPVSQVSRAAPLMPKTGAIPNIDGPSKDQENSEKVLASTRDEILAEREAKKLAKLAAKNKKKLGVTEATKQPKEDQTACVNDKSVIISSESQTSGVQKEVNHVEKDVSAAEKSKAALKAERRAKQEAQRAAKEASKKDTGKTKPAGAPAIKSESLNKEKPTSAQKAQSKPQVSKSAVAKSAGNQPKLLSHLLTDNRPLPVHIYQNVHPAIVELGAKYTARVVSGSNARCIALLQALKRVIVDFVTPREKEFSRAMETRLNDSMAYLNSCRQSSVSMTNALKHVKSHLTQLTTEKTTDDDARKKLCEVIDTFIKEQIDVAGEAISLAVAQKISNGDTIAIYGCSSLLLRILVESHNEGKDFEVVVVDGGPLYEGREMCRRLVSENIKCSYVLLPAFSYIVGQTTKVLLGAHALLANGCVMSRSGTAVVAMLAKAHNVPVIVCCETYKFCERVQADAFVHNELGPQYKVSTPPSISLMYDMTPPTLVDAVATELAILPCTSVPVVLRVKPSDVSSYYY